MAQLKTRFLEYASASFTHPGEKDCGDDYVVIDEPARTQVAVIDGLGHGPAAAAATQRAITELRRQRNKKPLSDLVRHSDTALRHTRGVAMTIAEFRSEAPNMTWLGVGNVMACLARMTPIGRVRCQLLMLRSGIVGRHPTHLNPSTSQVNRGDLIVFATDGINPAFIEDLKLVENGTHVANLARTLLSKHLKGTDDALMVVVRYLGR
jgi:phosphoserine phosphatase RsbX